MAQSPICEEANQDEIPYWQRCALNIPNLDYDDIPFESESEKNKAKELESYLISNHNFDKSTLKPFEMAIFSLGNNHNLEAASTNYLTFIKYCKDWKWDEISHKSLLQSMTLLSNAYFLGGEITHPNSKTNTSTSTNTTNNNPNSHDTNDKNGTDSDSNSSDNSHDDMNNNNNSNGNSKKNVESNDDSDDSSNSCSRELESNDLKHRKCNAQCTILVSISRMIFPREFDGGASAMVKGLYLSWNYFNYCKKLGLSRYGNCTIICTDLSGLRMGNFSLAFHNAGTYLLQYVYPMVVDTAYMIDAPLLMAGAISLVTNLIDTKNIKLRQLKKKDAFETIGDISQIPSVIGGTYDSSRYFQINDPKEDIDAIGIGIGIGGINSMNGIGDKTETETKTDLTETDLTNTKETEINIGDSMSLGSDMSCMSSMSTNSNTNLSNDSSNTNGINSSISRISSMTSIGSVTSFSSVSSVGSVDSGVNNNNSDKR